MEKISVIIVNWNVAKSLDRCLKSVFDAGYHNLDVWVIDNHSSDESVEVVKKHRRAKLIKNSTNIGFPKAVNQGLKSASGEYLLVLNPDTRLPRGFFSDSIKFFQEHPDAGLMGPKFLDSDGTSQGSVFREPSILATFRQFWLGERGLTEKYTPKSTTSVFAVSGACMFFPKSTLDKVGLLTNKVFMYFEDMDYCRRIKDMDMEVYFNADIAIIHEHGMSAKQSPQASDWRGRLWQSSLWYNGPIKHYLMWFIAWTGQKLRN